MVLTRVSNIIQTTNLQQQHERLATPPAGVHARAARAGRRPAAWSGALRSAHRCPAEHPARTASHCTKAVWLGGGSWGQDRRLPPRAASDFQLVAPGTLPGSGRGGSPISQPPPRRHTRGLPIGRDQPPGVPFPACAAPGSVPPPLAIVPPPPHDVPRPRRPSPAPRMSSVGSRGEQGRRGTRGGWG